MKKGISAAIIAATISVGLATGPAWAQDQTASEQAVSDFMADEILVTAQRRAQDVKDVPIAMSVISGDTMRDAGINQFNDLTLMVPNISVNTDWFTLFIRGVGTSEVNVMAEQAVAYMIDNVYVARVEFLRAGFLDVDRLEVLKGPQGVLFGRNSPAGVINITLGQPTEDWMGRGEVTMGELNTQEYRGMVSGPIVEDLLSFRIAASYVEREGHTENVFHRGPRRIGDRDITHVRAKLRFDFDDVDVTLGGVWFDYTFGAWASHEAHNVPEEWEIIFRTQDPRFDDELNHKGSTRDGSSAIGGGWMAFVDANWQIGDHTLTSVTSYSAYNDDSGGDLEATAWPAIEFAFENEYWQATEEIRLTSPPAEEGGDWEYIFGLFAFQSHSDALGEGLLYRDLDTNLISDIVVPDGIQSLFDTILSVTGPATLFEGDYISCICILDTLSFAGFGQVSWKVTDSITLMAGGRYTWEEKEFEAHLHAADDSVLWGPLLLNDGYDIYPVTQYENFSPKLSITWAAMEELTLYATYAEGFRSGSFNVASFKEEDVEFAPETSTTYEAGVKTRFMDGLMRVNVSLFWTDYIDYQVTTFETITFESSNAEEVRVRGVEADITAMPWQGFVAMLSGGYNDAIFVKYTDASCPTLSVTESGEGTCFLPQGPVNAPPSTSQDLSGQPLHRAPEYTFSANLVQAIPLGDWPVMAIVSGNATWRDFEFIDPDLDPKDSNEAHWIYGARIGLRHVEDIWSFEIQAKNLSDEIIKITSFDMAVTPGAHIAMTNQPRTILGTFKMQF